MRQRRSMQLHTGHAHRPPPLPRAGLHWKCCQKRKRPENLARFWFKSVVCMNYLLLPKASAWLVSGLFERVRVPLTHLCPQDSWEIVEGLRGGFGNIMEPQKQEGYMLKRRKWPMKGWHKVKKEAASWKDSLFNHFLRVLPHASFNLTVSRCPPTIKSADVPPSSINLIEWAYPASPAEESHVTWVDACSRSVWKAFTATTPPTCLGGPAKMH